MSSRIISATQNLARGHVIVATGEGFSTTLPARSVTTFVATTR
jgi:O-glycosyl hydrolase